MAVGSLEPQFYDQLLKGLELNEEDAPQNGSSEELQRVKKIFTEKFGSKTRAQWTEIFDVLDACVTPVLNLPEVKNYSHNKARTSFVQGNFENSTFEKSKYN